MKTFTVVDNPDGYMTEIKATSLSEAIKKASRNVLSSPESYNIGEDGISNVITLHIVQSDDDTNHITFDVEFNEDSINHAKNRVFEDLLIHWCNRKLNPKAYCDTPTRYADMVLDSMHNGTNYVDDFGNEWYYEIPARDTKDGIPFVVSV